MVNVVGVAVGVAVGVVVCVVWWYAWVWLARLCVVIEEVGMHG